MKNLEILESLFASKFLPIICENNGEFIICSLDNIQGIPVAFFLTPNKIWRIQADEIPLFMLNEYVSKLPPLGDYQWSLPSFEDFLKLTEYPLWRKANNTIKALNSFFPSLLVKKFDGVYMTSSIYENTSYIAVQLIQNDLAFDPLDRIVLKSFLRDACIPVRLIITL